MSSTEQTISFADVIQFVGASATEGDLEAIMEASKLRRRHLGQVRAAAIRVGDEVELRNLSPKYLNGLRGTVSAVGKHYQVELDANSLPRLQFGPGAKYLRAGADGTLTAIVAPPTCLMAT